MSDYLPGRQSDVVGRYGLRALGLRFRCPPAVAVAPLLAGAIPSGGVARCSSIWSRSTSRLRSSRGPRARRSARNGSRRRRSSRPAGVAAARASARRSSGTRRRGGLRPRRPRQRSPPTSASPTARRHRGTPISTMLPTAPASTTATPAIQTRLAREWSSRTISSITPASSARARPAPVASQRTSTATWRRVFGVVVIRVVSRISFPLASRAPLRKRRLHPSRAPNVTPDKHGVDELAVR